MITFDIDLRRRLKAARLLRTYELQFQLPESKDPDLARLFREARRIVGAWNPAVVELNKFLSRQVRADCDQYCKQFSSWFFQALERRAKDVTAKIGLTSFVADVVPEPLREAVFTLLFLELYDTFFKHGEPLDESAEYRLRMDQVKAMTEEVPVWIEMHCMPAITTYSDVDPPEVDCPAETLVVLELASEQLQGHINWLFRNQGSDLVTIQQFMDRKELLLNARNQLTDMLKSKDENGENYAELRARLEAKAYNNSTRVEAYQASN